MRCFVNAPMSMWDHRRHDEVKQLRFWTTDGKSESAVICHISRRHKRRLAPTESGCQRSTKWETSLHTLATQWITIKDGLKRVELVNELTDSESLNPFISPRFTWTVYVHFPDWSPLAVRHFNSMRFSFSQAGGVLSSTAFKLHQCCMCGCILQMNRRLTVSICKNVPCSEWQNPAKPTCFRRWSDATAFVAFVFSLVV